MRRCPASACSARSTRTSSPPPPVPGGDPAPAVARPDAADRGGEFQAEIGGVQRPAGTLRPGQIRSPDHRQLPIALFQITPVPVLEPRLRNRNRDRIAVTRIVRRRDTRGGRQRAGPQPQQWFGIRLQSRREGHDGRLAGHAGAVQCLARPWCVPGPARSGKAVIDNRRRTRRVRSCSFSSASASCRPSLAPNPAPSTDSTVPVVQARSSFVHPNAAVRDFGHLPSIAPLTERKKPS